MNILRSMCVSYRINYVHQVHPHIDTPKHLRKVFVIRKPVRFTKKKTPLRIYSYFSFFEKSFRFVHTFFSKNPFVSPKKKPANAEAETEAKQQQQQQQQQQRQRHCYPATSTIKCCDWWDPCAPSRKGCVVNDRMTNANNK